MKPHYRTSFLWDFGLPLEYIYGEAVKLRDRGSVDFLSSPYEHPMLDNLPLSLDALLALGLYGGLGFAYLLLLPAAILFYLKARWHKMGSVERFALYGLMFAFFPGILLLSPLLNFRPAARTLNP